MLGLIEEGAAMKTTKAVGFGNIAVAAVTGLLLTLPLQAEIKTRSGHQTVAEPADLPEMAQTPGQSLFLYIPADGGTITTSSSKTVRALPCSMLPTRQRS